MTRSLPGLPFRQMEATGPYRPGQPGVAGDDKDRPRLPAKGCQIMGQILAVGFLVMAQYHRRPRRQGGGRRQGVRPAAGIGHEDQFGQVRRRAYRSMMTEIHFHNDYVMKARMNSTPIIDASDIAGNLKKVRAEIRAAEAAAGRDAGSVALVAVSKIFPAIAAAAALAAGQRVFGENRVQEAEAKWPELKADFTDARLHLIGPLQRNKVKLALRLFDVIETVDRLKLARALAEGMEKTGARPDCFIQVNTGEEEQKAGVLPERAEAFVKTCREDFKLPVKGLMCIPPRWEEPALHFALLAEIAGRCGLQDLSMGMSADYQKAIALGATFVRLGTAVFGPRP